MEKASTYKGFDLTKSSQYDIATDEMPPIPIDFESETSDENERIISLLSYAEHYELDDLVSKLYELYGESLSVL